MIGVHGEGPIGVFDSGFGGLNTLRHLAGRLPLYDYLYLGDTARAPYGPRSAREIEAFSKQGVDFLQRHGCRLIIFACNTASSDALHSIQTAYVPERYPGTKVLGVLIPLAEEAVASTHNKKVGIIATEATVRSGAFLREISKLDSAVAIFQRAAPALVPLIESGDHHSDMVHNALVDYLMPLVEEGVDTLILGCTHYEALKDTVSAIIGPGIAILSEGPIVARKLETYLARHADLEQLIGRNSRLDFYSTGNIDRFDTLGREFFGRPIEAQEAVFQ